MLLETSVPHTKKKEVYIGISQRTVLEVQPSRSPDLNPLDFFVGTVKSPSVFIFD
jgi:hypothetical protein